MSSTLHIIAGTPGPHRRCIIYETCGGEKIFDSCNITPDDLFNILKSTNGCYEYINYHELTDEQMVDWQDHLYS